MARGITIWRTIDKYLLVMFLLLITGGVMTVYSSSYKGFEDSLLDWSSVHGKQFYWIIISVLAGIFILLLEGYFIKNLSYVIYILILLLLIGVLFMDPIKGARSWFQIGGFTIQPSELAKLSCSLAIAKYLSSISVKIQDIKTRVNVFALLILPAFLIMLQPDPGTMLVFFSFIFVMAF